VAVSSAFRLSFVHLFRELCINWVLWFSILLPGAMNNLRLAGVDLISSKAVDYSRRSL